MIDSSVWISPFPPLTDWEARELYYPETDGEPMGETDFHISAMLHLLAALRLFFRREERVYVGANMLFYFEEGNPAAYKVPDVFVVKGVSTHTRRVYKLWEEKVAPCTVFEITSRGTRLEDLGTKKGLYEMLGVKEYFLFDPLAEYLKPALQGFRLVEGYYFPMPPTSSGELTSREMGLLLRPEGAFLRLVDPATNDPLPTLDESVDAYQQATLRAEAEAQRAAVEAQRAEAEAQRAAVEAQRASDEAQRADAAEAEAARLRAQLEQLRAQMIDNNGDGSN